MERLKKTPVAAFLLALVCCVWFCLPAFAAQTGAAWGTVRNQQAVLYLQGAAPDAALQCQVGNTPVEVRQTAALSDTELPLQTVILLDNSLSIPQSQRPLIQTILETVVGNRLPGEQFTIATIAQDVTYLCEAQTDFLTVKSVIDNLQYNDQATQLTDSLYEVLQALQAKQDGVFRRIILVSDGVDNKELGYTREELTTLIQQTGYPIYAIGCGNAAATGNERLENLFALARLTSGATFYLQENQDANAIAAGIAAWNNALQVTIDLPPELCDGSDRMLQAVSGETTYTVSLAMPFAAVTPTAAPTASPVPDATPETAQTPETASAGGPAGGMLRLLLPLAAGVVVLALAGTVVVLLLRRRKKKDPFEHLPETAPGAAPAGDKTQLVPETEIDPARTALVWEDGDTEVRRLILTDVSDASRRFEVPLQGTVAVGRDPGACRIVIDYDPTVARHQCDIWQQGDQVMIQNRSTSNITQVNGQKIYGEYLLSSGSTLKMGRLLLRVEIV